MVVYIIQRTRGGKVFNVYADKETAQSMCNALNAMGDYKEFRLNEMNVVESKDDIENNS